MLISCASVFGVEGHHLIAIHRVYAIEHSLLFVVWVHPYAVIPRLCIHETQELKVDGGVKKLFDAWQREHILWTRLIEICIIYTHSPLPIRILY